MSSELIINDIYKNVEHAASVIELLIISNSNNDFTANNDVVIDVLCVASELLSNASSMLKNI